MRSTKLFAFSFLTTTRSFPFVNVNTLFVVFALGADDIFVVFDKWTNGRRQLPRGCTTEQLAVTVLPDAAYAIFVTSITTAAAFLASTTARVTSISLFSMYCGFVVAADLFLCIALVFPAICLHDQRLTNGSKSCLGRRANESVLSGDSMDAEELRMHACPSGGPRSESLEAGTTKSACCHRYLSSYYMAIHKMRWVILLLSSIATAFCGYMTTRLMPPDQPDQPFLRSNNKYEIHRVWSRELMSYRIAQGNAGKVVFIWGLLPADTGSRLDPIRWKSSDSMLVFDPDADLRGEATQNFILDMCGTVFEGESSLRRPSHDYTCLMSGFDTWLRDQSRANDTTDEYTANCGGASSVPVPADIFDSCLMAYTDIEGSSDVIFDGGSVQVISIKARSNTTSFSPIEDQGKEWISLESWSEIARSNAPRGGDNFFFSSADFWVFDTIDSLRASAYKSALIATVCALAMILLTARSLTLSVFSAISVSYVLVASTACVVGLGWTMGM